MFEGSWCLIPLVLLGGVLSTVPAVPRGTGPFVSIEDPVSGSVHGRSEPGWRLQLNVNLTGTSHEAGVVRTNPLKFIICVSGDLGGNGILFGAPNCVPLVPTGEAGEGASVNENLLLMRPAANVPYSSAKVWLQHGAWSLNPNNAIGPSALDTIYLWTKPEAVIEALSALVSGPLALTLAASERGSALRALSLAYQGVADSLSETIAQSEETPSFLDAKHDPFPCEAPPGDEGYVAIKMHRTVPYRGAAYDYLKVPLPVPPHMWTNSMSFARDIMWDLFRSICVRTAQGSPAYITGSSSDALHGFEVKNEPPFDSNWTTTSCVAWLLDQFEERTRLLCNKTFDGIEDAVLEEAVLELQEDVEALRPNDDCAIDMIATKNGSMITLPAISPPNLTLAGACLELTTPGIVLQYPDDAEAHFAELQTGLAPFSQFKRFPRHRYHYAAGYRGPWLENVFITDITTRSRKIAAFQLRDVTGPFIPILLPWTDLWEPESQRRLPPDLVPTLRRLLRKTVPYVTLVQHDSGLAFHCGDFLNQEFPNILVLSAGGFGHVPIPLFKQNEDRNNAKTVAERAHVISYVGSRDNAPMEMRHKMIQAMEVAASQGNYSAKYFRGETWRSIMADSRFSLCPRGNGRTSYHLVETVQMGLLPVHVHLEGANEAWVPYELIWPQIGFATDVGGLPDLLSALAEMPLPKVKAREAVVESFRESHFTRAGVLKQIRAFLTATKVASHSAADITALEYASTFKSERRKIDRITGDGSDLVCRRLPTYPTTSEAGMALLSDEYRDIFRPGFDPMCIQWQNAHRWEEM
jgi:hypothetical protein